MSLMPVWTGLFDSSDILHQQLNMEEKQLDFPVQRRGGV